MNEHSFINKQNASRQEKNIGSILFKSLAELAEHTDYYIISVNSVDSNEVGESIIFLNVEWIMCPLVK